jgi:hypothetical protein
MEIRSEQQRSFTQDAPKEQSRQVAKFKLAEGKGSDISNPLS